MSSAKKKSHRFQKKNPQHGASPVRPRSIQRTWPERLEACIGWLVCCMVVISPLVFHARSMNFADLPQRTFLQCAVALFGTLGLMRAAVLRSCLVPRDICSCAAAVFACWAVASVAWSSSPYDALYASLHWAACAFAVLGVVAWLHQDAWLKRFSAAIICAGSLVSAVAFAQLFFGMRRIPSVKVPSAAFANPNVLAEFLGMTFIFTLCAGWFVRRRPLLSAACWSSAAAQVVVLYYTTCRAAWLAIVIAMLWGAVLLVKRTRGWRWAGPVVLCVLCMIIVAGATLPAKPGMNRLLDGSARYRLIVWDNTLELVKQRPFTGYGAGSFPYMYGAVVNTYQSDSSFGKTVQIRRAHNDFLQAAVELGLPGSALLLVFLGGVLILSLRLMVEQATVCERFVLHAASGALLACLVTSFFGFSLQRAVTPFLAFLSAGMVIAIYCRRQTSFVCIRRQGVLAAAVLLAAVAGIVVLRFNLAIIESDGFYKRALAMERRGNNAKALAWSQRAHKACPGRMDVLTTVGRAYVTTGRLGEGIEALETVTTRQPYHLNALFILGAAYANAGRSAEALETFRRVLTIKPDFVEAQRIVSRLKSQGRVKVNFK